MKCLAASIVNTFSCFAGIKINKARFGGNRAAPCNYIGKCSSRNFKKAAKPLLNTKLKQQ